MSSLVLADAVVPSKSCALLKNAALVFGGSMLLALSARVNFPIGPVPFSAQTFAVCLLGALLGGKRAALSVLTYLAEGAMGLPVFASGAGLLYMAGPTGGYLAGFIAAAYLTGCLAERGWDRAMTSTLAMMLAAEALILLCGFAWLSVLAGAKAALFAGVLPFLAGAVLKSCLATALLPSAWKLIRRV